MEEIVNKTFLTMALHSGLDLPIINPNVSSMVWAVKAYKVLADIDKNSMDYIEYSNNNVPQMSVAASVNNTEIKADTSGFHLSSVEAEAIFHAMETGMKSEGRNLTKEYLMTKDPMEFGGRCSKRVF